MSYAGGWAALNLEMPDRVPRTEYSAHFHWDLVAQVTGMAVGPKSDAVRQQAASNAFCKAWDYAMNWSTLVHTQPFGDLRTKMGHAVYAAGGVDYDNDIRCPFEDVEDVLNFDPMEAYGPCDEAYWKAEFEKHYQKNVQSLEDQVHMTGIYSTCISGLLEIFGWDMLLWAAGEDRKRFVGLTDRYARWIQGYFNALAQSDVPCVMIHDDIVWTEGAIFQPAFYRECLFEHYKHFFRPILDSGKRLLFTSDGNYTQFIDDIAQTGVHCFVMEPTTDMAQIAERYGKTHAFIGNADTRILLLGSRAEIEGEVKRCMDIGKACPGFIMAVGNHIPANTPIENCYIYNDAYEKYARR